MLQVKKLSKSDILFDMSFSIDAGKIVGIIGPSGAGKSTLLRCINQLTDYCGDIEFAGESSQMTMIFQQFNLIEQKTVLHNVAMPLVAKGQTLDIALTTKIMDLLALCGIQDKADQYPENLSGGQKQRVAIARALITDPTLLLADEATSALDPQSTQAILELLQTIRDRMNITILVVTHEMHIIKQLCDEAIVLENGKLIEQASVIDLLISPQSKATQALVADTIHLNLPRIIAEKVNQDKIGLPLFRFAFIGDVTTQPLLSRISRDYAVQINILQADIEHVQNKTLGFMLATMDGQKGQIDIATDFLTEHDCKVTLLGYVDTNMARDA